MCTVQRHYECKDDVIRALLKRELQGMSLKTRAVLVDDRPLYVAAIKNFGRWSKAVRAAGIDPETTSGRRIWSPERVLRSIRDLERAGVALNSRSVSRADPGLQQAAYRFWGAWDNTLLAAGFDPLAVRVPRRPWTKSAIIKAIQVHAQTGTPLTWNSMRPHSAGTAARRLFGSFQAAVKAAGLTPARPPAKLDVKAAIRRRQQQGEPLNCAAVIRSEPRLYDAARRRYRGWNEALQACGIAPERVRGIRPPWTAEDVIREFRRRVAEASPPTCISSIRPIPWVQACQKFFGSFQAAAEAAGVDPRKIGYVRTPEPRRA